jgi:cellulose biosynthesis protein BcsQ
MTRAFEAASSDNVTLRKQVKEQAELLYARKDRKRGKRVALKGWFVFSTQEVLDIARSAEAESSKKRSTTRPKRRKAKRILEAEVNRELDVVLIDSGSDCIIVRCASELIVSQIAW